MKDSKKLWLISFPGSGNTFLRYILEVIYGRATLGANPTDGAVSSIIDMSHDRRKLTTHREVSNWINADGDFNNKVYDTSTIDFNRSPSVIKSHTFSNDLYEYDQGVFLSGDKTLSIGKNEWSNQSPIIFIVRDPYEVVAGRILKRPEPEKTVDRELFDIDLPGYLPLLRDFENHEGNKLLIRYEHLMNNGTLIGELVKVCSFISNNHPEGSHDEAYDVSRIEKNIAKFMKNIDIHRQNSAVAYTVRRSPGRNDINYWKTFRNHHARFCDNDIDKIYQLCRDFDQDLYHKYLEIYRSEIPTDTPFDRYAARQDAAAESQKKAYHYDTLEPPYEITGHAEPHSLEQDLKKN